MTADCATKCLRVFTNGLFTMLTVAILVMYFANYVFVYVPKKIDEDLTNVHKQLEYTVFVVVIVICDVMAFWSLAKAYMGGPGYVSDYFRCERVRDRFFEGSTESENRQEETTYALLYAKDGKGKWENAEKGKDEEEGESLLLKDDQSQDLSAAVAYFTIPADEKN